MGDQKQGDVDRYLKTDGLDISAPRTIGRAT